jgi:hypothetical protein
MKHDPVVYFIQLGKDGPIKIGCTCRFFARYQDLLKRRPRPFRDHSGKPLILGVFSGDRDKEKEIHRRFADCRYEVPRSATGWVPCEYFEPTTKLLTYIKRHTIPPPISLFLIPAWKQQRARTYLIYRERFKRGIKKRLDTMQRKQAAKKAGERLKKAGA